MKPIDYRNETWASVQARVVGLRLDAWLAWQRHGPGTTREVAAKAHIDILTFRPRTTELYQLGLVKLVTGDGNEGVYQALSEDEAMRVFFEQQRATKDETYQREFLLR